jgi:hypothetical protein
MITWLIRLLLLMAGGIAALFLDRSAPNFPVVEGMIAVALLAAAVLAVALLRRRGD